MTPEQRKEEISKAYLHAVAAACGYAVGSWSQDHGGIDATIGAAAAVGNGTVKPKVDVQLKSTSRTDIQHSDYVSWQLRRRQYDDLRAPALTPHLLVVLVLPEDGEEETWVEHTVEHLLIRRCAYWCEMTGLPSVTVDNPTVKVPKNQVFSPETLGHIMAKNSRKETL